jgi:hypothetical protein
MTAYGRGTFQRRHRGARPLVPRRFLCADARPGASLAERFPHSPWAGALRWSAVPIPMGLPLGFRLFFPGRDAAARRGSGGEDGFTFLAAVRGGLAVHFRKPPLTVSLLGVPAAFPFPGAGKIRGRRYYVAAGGWLPAAPASVSLAGQAGVLAGGENTGDRRLRPRGAEGLGASAGNGGRLGTESSVPAFSRSGCAPGAKTLPAFSRTFAGTEGGIATALQGGWELARSLRLRAAGALQIASTPRPASTS